MKNKGANDNECGENMIWGECKRWEQSQISLCKCYQNILTYESVKLMKRPVSMSTQMKVLRLTHLIIMMRWEIIYWAMMSSYKKPASMKYELNVVELYTEHRYTSYERWCLLSGKAEAHVTLMRWDCLACRVWVFLYLVVFELILPI